MRLPLLWTDGSLVAASGTAVSGWIDVSQFDSLRVGRVAAGGTFALEVDWSRDGSTVDFTEAITVADATSVSKPVAGKLARFRVRNTGAGAFTSHRTTVYGK